jgi:hypothetical protein
MARMRRMRMHRIYHKKVMSRDCSRLSWERERLDHALRGAAGHGRPCPYGSPARSGGWRGTADRARTGRPRALGGGGARQTVPGGVARAPRGAAGHGMPCPYGSPALPGGWWGHGMPCPDGSPARSGAWWGTADRARTGRPRAPGGGGARQTVSRRGRPRAPGRGGARQTVPVRVARALRGVAGHGRPCAEGSPARSGGWRGMVCRARRGRPRAPGGGGAWSAVRGGVARALRGVAGHGMTVRGGVARALRGVAGARQTVPRGVACAPWGAAGHGMPCPYGSPALPGGWWGTACRARRGRLRAPGGGGARQTVSGGVARAPRGVVGHGMPCPEGSPARSGGCAVPTLNAPQPVLYYFPPDDIASRVSVDHMIAGRSDHGANGD